MVPVSFSTMTVENRQITTSAFQEGGDIPRVFTCDGQDISPPLQWADAPAGTACFALIVEDPDAPRGTWVHWVLYDLPVSERTLPQGVPTSRELPSGARQGQNDFRKIGYGGPCPPPGTGHRYYFRLYALDSKLDLDPGIKKTDLERAMSGHIIGQAELMGRYRR